MVLGTHTSGSEQNYLMVATTRIPHPEAEIDARKYDDEKGGALSRLPHASDRIPVALTLPWRRAAPSLALSQSWAALACPRPRWGSPSRCATTVKSTGASSQLFPSPPLPRPSLTAFRSQGKALPAEPVPDRDQDGVRRRAGVRPDQAPVRAGEQ